MTEDQNEEIKILKNYSDKFIDIEKKLILKEKKLIELETKILEKNYIFEEVENRLNNYEETLKKFNQLISIFENKIENENNISREEILDNIKNLDRIYEEYYENIDEEDLIKLLSKYYTELQ